ncbi:protrudin-like isoform X1 [Acipenser ruthenus]|uniref:protrudin-like isoform X1 n=2 Tax=Acipenser ruthenus TaxID=7906 RepID=UPI00145AE6B8|nr:protrudin-like isoform X1 [Acipenser ruthenus]
MFSVIATSSCLRKWLLDFCLMQTGAMVAPEQPQGSAAAVTGERGDLAELAHGDGGVPELPELHSPKPQTFDLFNMVISFKRMEIFLEPLTDTWELVKYLLRWRMPVCSLLCCLILNIIFLTLSEVAWFSLLLLGISAPAVLGYIQDCSQESPSELVLQRKRHHAVQRQDLQTVHLSREEALLEVKGLLVQLDDILSRACLSAESVYRVLYWENHNTSFLFYGGLLTALCLWYMVPFCWILALVNSALYLWNREFVRVVLEYRESFHQRRLKPKEGDGENMEPELASFMDRTPTPTSVEDLSPGSVDEAEEAEPDDEFKDAIEEQQQLILPEQQLILPEDDEVPQCTADFDLGVTDIGLLSRNEPIRSKVSKLTEKLRKRYPTNNCGNCSSCNAVFSVLKKRRSCSNCGNSFCSRCCSYKVLKSSMGATAPEAQRETVFVCSPCNQSLSKKE